MGLFLWTKKILISGEQVRGCIYFDRSKKDTTATGKVRWHKRWEAAAGYYGVTFRKRSKSPAILEDFLLDLKALDDASELEAIAERCKRINPDRKWPLPYSVRGLVEHSMASKKESFAINQN